ncbi:carbohydrate kinase family protein [Candidatus Woesearchaeota archaeon]|nr:carbohydrate kinase family protein [Candidatus Woesearchaeota archaeon]
MFDIISIGSATTDCFVKAKPEGFIKRQNHIDVCYAVGQKVLIESMEHQTGGGGTNTAVAFARLGLKTGYAGIVGNDAHSKEILEELKHEGITFLGKQKNGQTGYSIILTGLKNDRTILAYKGINDSMKPADLQIKDAKWYYISSFIGDSFVSAQKILRKIKKPWTFNPSMYLAKKGINNLKEFVQGCGLLIMNKEEAMAALGKTESMKQMAQELGKKTCRTIITDGKNGALGYDGKFYKVFPRRINVIETTGAGDAFAAGCTAAILMGMKFSQALKLGQAEAESVLCAIGAKNNLLRKNRAIEEMKNITVREL